MELIFSIAILVLLVWALRGDKKLDEEIHGKPEKKVQPPLKIPDHSFDDDKQRALEMEIQQETIWNKKESKYDFVKIENNPITKRNMNLLLDTVRGGFIVNCVSKTKFSDVESAVIARKLLIEHLNQYDYVPDSQNVEARVDYMFEFLTENFEIMEQVANHGGLLNSKVMSDDWVMHGDEMDKYFSALRDATYKTYREANKIEDFMDIMRNEFGAFKEGLK